MKTFKKSMKWVKTKEAMREVKGRTEKTFKQTYGNFPSYGIPCFPNCGLDTGITQVS